MSFAAEPFKAWYLPFPSDAAVRTSYIEVLKPLFANRDIAKIGQNIKFDLMILKGLGIDVRGRMIDTIFCTTLSTLSRVNMNFRGALLGVRAHRHRGAHWQGC